MCAALTARWEEHSEDAGRSAAHLSRRLARLPRQVVHLLLPHRSIAPDRPLVQMGTWVLRVSVTGHLPACVQLRALSRP